MALTNCGSLDASVLTNPALAKLIPTFAEEIMSDLLSPPLPKNYSEYEGFYGKMNYENSIVVKYDNASNMLTASIYNSKGTLTYTEDDKFVFNTEDPNVSCLDNFYNAMDGISIWFLRNVNSKQVDCLVVIGIESWNMQHCKNLPS